MSPITFIPADLQDTLAMTQSFYMYNQNTMWRMFVGEVFRDEMNRELEYYYSAVITKVVDGDTVRASVDLGMDVRIDVTLRLYGIDAPEISTPAGVLSRAAVREWLVHNASPESSEDAWEVVVHTIKDKREKYGRYLAEVYGVKNPNNPYASTSQLNSYLVGNKFASPYDGGKRQKG